MTIQEAIDTLIRSVPGAPFPDTVDTIKVGDAAQELAGIAVAFLATAAVIEQAVQKGANLLITHEPLFYNHLDQTDWLASNPVYHSKRQLLQENRLVVWRFHDYLHSIPPDSTCVGLLSKLDWQPNVSPAQPYLTDIPPMTLQEIAQRVKERMGLPSVRVVGDLTMQCRRVAVLPGFPPATYQIGALGEGADVLIAGEIHEWETSEYVRDANRLGYKKGLVVIGHAASEEPGIERMLPWLQERLPGVQISFLPTANPFHYM